MTQFSVLRVWNKCWQFTAWLVIFLFVKLNMVQYILLASPVTVETVDAKQVLMYDLE